MRRNAARLLATGAALLLVIGAAALALASREKRVDLSPRVESERPALMLLTTLPLVFPEEFSLQGGGSKALAALETRYRVVTIGTTDATSLGKGRLLLMAHPLAQPAEALVDLDRWVRDGGRVLLLADPKLEWPSKRPLGDKLRPPPAFADTGLLGHWGLRLDAPDEAGPRTLELGDRSVLTVSPGSALGRVRDRQVRVRRPLQDRSRPGDRHRRRRLPRYRATARAGQRQSRRAACRACGARTVNCQGLTKRFADSVFTQTYPQAGRDRTGQEHPAKLR